MNRDPQRTSELRLTLRALRRRSWIIVLCVLGVGGSAAAFSLIQHKLYSASATLLFRDPALDQKLFSTSALPPSSDPTRQAATNVSLVSLPVVADRTAKALDHGLTQSRVESEVSVSQSGQADLALITATDRSPSLAAHIATTYAQQYISFRQQADRSKVEQAVQLVRGQLSSLSSLAGAGVGPAGQTHRSTLQNYAEQLQILAALQTGNAELVQPAATPTSPSSPKTVRNVILGVLLGLGLGLALALLFERLDRTLSEPNELADLFELPLLATIPRSRRLASRTVGADDDGAASELEPFRMLRTMLRYFNVDRQITSLVVTSPSPRDGKTTVATHLAIANAIAGSRVLLLEVDLRRPTIANALGLDGLPGLAETLSGGASLQDVVQSIQVGPATASGDRRQLDVIVAGAIPPNPAELLESAHMFKLLSGLTSVYDLVILDSAPAGTVSDTIPLMQDVSGVIVVGAVRRTTRHAAAKLRDQLAAVDAPMLGVVANMISIRGDAYGYGYGYGYESVTSREGRAAKNGRAVAAGLESGPEAAERAGGVAVVRALPEPRSAVGGRPEAPVGPSPEDRITSPARRRQRRRWRRS